MAGAVVPYGASLSTIFILKVHIYSHQAVFLRSEFLSILLFIALMVLP